MNNEPAFPHLRRYVTGNTYEPIAEGGMTLRDYFAAKAMQGMCASFPNVANKDLKNFLDELPASAYFIADAMLEARKK